MLGRVRLGVADAPGSKQVVDFARTTVEPGSLIRTDGARMFRVLADEGFTHEYTSGYSSPEPGHVTLPGPHRIASLLKRWNAGTHHYRVEREHLQCYLDEFAFRMRHPRCIRRRDRTVPHLRAGAGARSDGHPRTRDAAARRPRPLRIRHVDPSRRHRRRPAVEGQVELAQIIPTSGKNRQQRTPLTVRVIDYTLDDGRENPDMHHSCSLTERYCV